MRVRQSRAGSNKHTPTVGRVAEGRIADGAMASQLAPTAFHAVAAVDGAHAGYEWKQNVEEIELRIAIEPGLGKRDLTCKLSSTHIAAHAIVDGKRRTLIDHDLSNAIKPDESFWSVDGTVLELTLQKAVEGAPWEAVFAGHENALDAHAKESEKKRLLLERFQLEHPGFDFSGAEVSGGHTPDPSTFMGGFHR